MKHNTQSPQSPVPESTYLLTHSNGGTREVKATRIGVNESGALLIMKQNPQTLRHDPVRIVANGNWASIEIVDPK